MASQRQLPPVSAALRNAELRRVLVAYFASCISEWALWSGMLVYAYETSGQTVAGFVAVSLLVPGALIAPFAGSAADGPRPNRVLTTVYAVQTVALASAAIVAYLDGPLLGVVVPTVIASTVFCYIRPCFSVVVPGLVRSAGELTAANLLTGYCDSSCVLIGPLIASGLIALDGPPFVLAACAGLALLAVAVTLPLIRLIFGDTSVAPSERHGSRTGALVDGVRALGQRTGALQLLAVLTGLWVLSGALDLILVVLATAEFDLGPSGPGILGAAFGFGALLGGAASTVLVARTRLAPLLMVSMLAICGSLFAIAGTPKVAVAFVFLPIAGLGWAVLDLAGRMLMQRVAPQDALASIFATMESLGLIGCAVGSIVAQVVIAASGVRAAVLTLGVVLGTLLLSTAKRLLQVDASADAPVVAIRLLRRIPVFAPLPGPAMEGVARAAQPVRMPSGHTIIREGERGTSYFAIVTGDVDVTMDGRRIRTMSRGQGFGEIALLVDVPRTATVTATTDVELLEIERPAFLTAVTGYDASKQAAWGVARTWHPALASSEAEARSDD